MDPWTDRRGRRGRATQAATVQSPEVLFLECAAESRAAPRGQSSPRCRSRKRFNHCDRPSAALQLPGPGHRRSVQPDKQPQCFRAGHVLRCLPIHPSMCIHPSPSDSEAPYMDTLRLRAYASAGRCSASSARAREESDGARPRFSTPRYSCDGGGRNDGRDGSEVATPTIYTSKQVARSSAFHTLISFRVFFFFFFCNEEETCLARSGSGGYETALPLSPTNNAHAARSPGFCFLPCQ